MRKIVKKITNFRHTIYGNLVYFITLFSILIFISVGFIFRSVNNWYLNKVIQQNGNNIGSLVEGALYYSMLNNDRSSLENTLDIINMMPGIDQVSMYDNQNNLVYSSFAENNKVLTNPDCKGCHEDINTMFPEGEKVFKILNVESRCKMNLEDYDYRLLLMHTPILNDKSCNTSDCHAHSKNEKILGSFIISIPLSEMDTTVMQASTNFFIFATLASILLILILIYLTKKKIINPLNGIIRASKAVSNGEKNIKLEIGPRQLKDLKLVSTAFNEMLDTLQSSAIELQNWSHQLEYKVQKKTKELTEIQSELIHAERIASLGKLSSSVAHEINNPLTGVLTYTKLVQKQLSKPNLDQDGKGSVLKYLTIIEQETKRCGEIVKSLLEFSRKDKPDFKKSHLHAVLRESYNLMSHHMKISNINFLMDFTASNDLINCSENQIKQACIALLVNSSDAVSDNGEIIIKTTNPDDEHILFEIIDNGMGISEKDLPHIFEPFFSGKKGTDGIGLGLAVVHGIIQNHNGTVKVTSKTRKGTTMAVTLPLTT